jgi:phosphoribosylformimino-5-aminoimidazole carboxamide ribotide isomerase
LILYAAIDLRAGNVVQLVGGRPDAERISLRDPVGVARTWIAEGFRALHIVDLDAALGTGDNRAAILAILEAVDVPVHVGGGVRSEDAVDAWLSAGAARVIIGTRALEDPAWLEQVTRDWPGRVIVAADVRGDYITTRGWTADSAVHAETFLTNLDQLPLGAALVTDVSREGTMSGIDDARFHRLVRATRHPLIAAGGIGGFADLQALRAAGAAGAVLGMSLYTGAVTAAMAHKP